MTDVSSSQVPEFSVDRKFLIFQLSLDGVGLRSFGGVDPYTGEAKPGLPGAFKFIDPLDWEDPNAPEYWRNILDDDYTTKLNANWERFKKNFFDAVDAADGGISLRKDVDGNHFRDVTDLVRSVSGYSTAVDSFSNGITILLSQESTLDKSTAFVSFEHNRTETPNGSDAATRALELSHTDISENDVLMIRVSRDGGKTYELEFMGFVTSVMDDSSYGALTARTLSVSGMSKLFSLSTIIKQKAIGDSFEQVGQNVNKAESPAVLSTLFQGKNTKEITTELLDQVMAWRELTELETASGDVQNKTAQLYTVNDAQFSAEAGARGFQFNIFTLLTIYFMKTTIIDSPTVFEQKLFPAAAPNTSTTGNRFTLLDKGTMAVMEHGDHVVWNDTVASGFDNFFSQTTTPEEIFNDLRSYTFYDVFESRDGTIIVRPPRYNRIELSDTEYSRTFLDSNQQSDASILSILSYDSQTNKFMFNPSADFFISTDVTVDDVDAQREDAQLETTSYTKWTMPYVGPIDFPAGVYQDPNLLIKYGLRTQGPVDNPNVTNDKMGTLYAPVVLGMMNAKTRKTSVVVRDVRTFRPGKLYYIEDTKQVAYLVSDEISYQYGEVSRHSLAFNMVRRVVDVPIKDIQNSPNMLLNFALMYLTDPRPSSQIIKEAATSAALAAAAAASPEGALAAGAAAGAGAADRAEAAANATSMKTNLRRRAAAMLENLAKIAQGTPWAIGSVTIPMFRYVPTILDVITDIDETPSIATGNKTGVSRSDQAAIDKRRRELGESQAVALGGRFYATEITLYGENVAEIVQPLGVLGDGGFPDVVQGVGPIDFLRGVGGSGVWGDYNPRVGLARYGQVLGLADKVENTTTGRPLFIYSEDLKEQPLVSSPIYVKQISENEGIWEFNQVLVNKLCALDLSMKYDLFEKIPNYGRGFPQFYGWDGNTHSLFGTYKTPTQYTTDAYEFGAGFTSNAIAKDSPNILKLAVGSSSWKNSCFEIPSCGKNEYNMPFGHVMVLGFSAEGRILPKFVYLSGGRYRFTYTDANTSVLIEALGKATVLLDAESVEAPAGGDALENNKVIKIELPVDPSTTALAQFVFLSPYLEPTIERMLELGLPPDLCGYRSNKKSSGLATKASPLYGALLLENDFHRRGYSLDVCVEALTYASESDLRILPALAPRMTALMKSIGFDETDASTFRLIVNPDNLKLFWNYPDGTPGKGSPSDALNYFHMGITFNQSGSYVNKVQNRLGAVNPRFPVPGATRG